MDRANAVHWTVTWRGPPTMVSWISGHENLHGRGREQSLRAENRSNLCQIMLRIFFVLERLFEMRWKSCRMQETVHDTLHKSRNIYQFGKNHTKPTHQAKPIHLMCPCAVRGPGISPKRGTRSSGPRFSVLPVGKQTYLEKEVLNTSVKHAVRCAPQAACLRSVEMRCKHALICTIQNKLLCSIAIHSCKQCPPCSIT